MDSTTSTAKPATGEISKQGFKLNKGQTAITTIAIAGIAGFITHKKTKSIMWTVVATLAGATVGFFADSKIQKSMRG